VAATVHERRGDVEAAIRHSWQAGDHDRATDLIRDNVLAVFLDSSAPPPVDPRAILDADDLRSPGDAAAYIVAFREGRFRFLETVRP
jgi:hypothetical protein